MLTLFQSTALQNSIGTRFLSLIYKGIAPGDEKQCLPLLDPSCKRLASGLLELAFSFGGLVGKIAIHYAILMTEICNSLAVYL
jgi:DNA-dependent protein kinase catalytic subunit